MEIQTPKPDILEVVNQSITLPKNIWGVVTEALPRNLSLLVQLKLKEFELAHRLKTIQVQISRIDLTLPSVH